VKYLLDVNTLVAWGWEDHAEHSRVARWVRQQRSNPGSLLLTSAIPQLGFVRVSVQRAAGQVTVEEAAEILAGMLATLGDRHAFAPDNQVAKDFPSWCRTAAQTTDAHLSKLAQSLGAKLATCDQGISGTLLIPR
jgi:predicted nucleic acid-binding protein